MLTDCLCRWQMLMSNSPSRWLGTEREARGRNERLHKTVVIGACSDEKTAIIYQGRFATRQAADLARSGEPGPGSTALNLRAVRQTENWSPGVCRPIDFAVGIQSSGKELLQQRLLLQMQEAQCKERSNGFSVQKGMWRNGEMGNWSLGFC